MLEWDALSALITILTRHANDTDLLVWDLTDERLGIYIYEDGTVLTSSTELRGLMANGAPAALGRHVPFGSDEHYRRFDSALASFINRLERLQLLHKTLLLAPAWAETTETGEPTSSSFGMTAREANTLNARYLELIERKAGIPVFRVNDTRASVNHPWGKAPFHYSEAAYQTMARELLRRIGEI